MSIPSDIVMSETIDLVYLYANVVNSIKKSNMKKGQKSLDILLIKYYASSFVI